MMDTNTETLSLPLVARLKLCADLWCCAQAATPAKLGRTVINDGGFFARVAAPDASTTTGTLEKFARFLGDPANWPGNEVPDDVREFVHVIGITADVDQSATGQAGELSGGPSTLRQAQGSGRAESGEEAGVGE